MVNYQTDFATKEKQFDVLHNTLKEHFSGLVAFEFQQASALTIAIGWFATSGVGREFVASSLIFKMAMTVFGVLLTLAHADWVESFYRRSENAYRRLVLLNYIPEDYYAGFRFRRVMICGCKLTHMGLMSLFLILVCSV
ncbi:MAG: hypothetical protein F6K19_15960 [Cyanothece sp. SIO1E1]|nr:hypothetical protein [Cyanothece sp. SIO1E1]